MLNMNVNSSFIKAIREDLGYSPQQFGQLFQVAPATIVSWENGVTVPNGFYIPNLIKLREKVNEMKARKKDEDIGKFLKGLLVTGGIFALFIWLYSKES